MNQRVSFNLLSLGIASISMALLAFGFGGEFILDDRPNIEGNLAIHVTELTLSWLMNAAYSFNAGSGSRALPMLTFAIDHWRGGLDPDVFRSTNLVIHGVTILVTAHFARRFFILAGWNQLRAHWAALAVATIWAFHPIQVSSVLYIVQRMQTLATLFLLLTLHFYLKARQAQIEGAVSRPFWLMALLSWSVAFGCKEDAALLAPFVILIEFLVLDFRGTNGSTLHAMRKAYVIGVAACFCIFAFIVVPYYWTNTSYVGRDFSTYERLLTQGRVLLLYLFQIVFPAPGNLPFYYDDYQVSRGLLDPLSTLPSLLAVAALLCLAWMFRHRRPVFSFGVLFFFSGHFITSNVIGLELAFEHRNHLPLLGVLIALADLVFLGIERCRLEGFGVISTVLLVVIGAAFGTLERAQTWADPIEFGKKSVEYAPGSVRAWLALCTSYYRKAQGNPKSPYFDQAIVECEKAGDIPYSASPLGNVVIFKSIKGTITDVDWEKFIARLGVVTMTVENKSNVWVMVNNLRNKVSLDEQRVIQTIQVVSSRTKLQAAEYFDLAYFFLNDTSQPDLALDYFSRAFQLSSANDEPVEYAIKALERSGRANWVALLKERLEH